jgi:hypothetical protein
VFTARYGLNLELYFRLIFVFGGLNNIRKIMRNRLNGSYFT